MPCRHLAWHRGPMVRIGRAARVLSLLRPNGPCAIRWTHVLFGKLCLDDPPASHQTSFMVRQVDTHGVDIQ